MTKDEIKASINACAIHMRDSGPSWNILGICHNMYKTPKGCINIDYIWGMLPYFKTWEHYSGNPGYPIPEKPLTKWQRFRVKYMGAIIGNPYTMYSDGLGMWDKNTQYGQLRWDLLEHIIKEIT